MVIRFLLYCLCVLPTCVFADAGAGQFMGYELGTRYQAPAPDFEMTTTGDLLIAAANPTKPGDINEVSLVVTRETHTIGYIVASSWYATEGEAREVGRRYLELLRAKYPDWAVRRELMDTSFRIVQVDLGKAPYTLQLRLARDEKDGDGMWRFSMGLGWQSESGEWQAWRSQAADEQDSMTTAENEELMREADVRGL